MSLGKFLAPLNNPIKEKPYVDDIFDPLFNARVKEYYNGLYGPIGGIGAGYADMLDNALLGQKGILGPGMGILSTFGRSMDKADDFILGGLTEGVNALGQFTNGLNEAPQNPLHRIFVDDYDYQGSKLMAAAGNAMARLAGNQTPLDESDFQSFGDKIAGTTLDLATDPGILGGQLARLNPNTPVGQVGHVLDEYDNLMANVAGNMAIPGGKMALHNFIKKVKDVNKGLGAFTTGPIKDTVIKQSPASTELRNLVDNYIEKYNITPEHLEWQDYEDFIKDIDPSFKTAKEISEETLRNRAKTLTDAEVLANPVTHQKAFIENVINDALGDLKKKYHLPMDAKYEDVLNYIKAIDGKNNERLYPYLVDMADTFRLTKQGRKNITNTDIAKPMLDKAEDLIKRGWNDSEVAKFQRKLSEMKPNIVLKDEFLDRLLTTSKQTTIINAKDPSVTSLINNLTHNVNEINKHASKPLVSLVNIPSGSNLEIGIKLNTANLDWIKDFQKISKQKLDLHDVVFKTGDSTLKFSPKEQELLDFFNELDASSKRYSNWLGIPRKGSSLPHLRMLIKDSPDAASLAMKHYEKLGLDKSQADLLLAEIQNANNRLVKKGAFGTVDIANSYLGPLKNSPYKYNYNLRAIAASTYLDSYMDNVDVQATVCLMDNPMYTLKNRFDSVQSVKAALDAGEGNQNLTLATLKFNDKGQIIGFHRYDKFSEADIQKAFADEHCILCPEDIVGHLEHAFLSNKRTPPKIVRQLSQLYKASILNNFGFPLGNFGDAFVKQSVEIGRQFGDTPIKALTDTAQSMKSVLDLNNYFDKYVMQDFTAFLESDVAKKHPFFKKYAANNIALNPGTIFNKPELTKMFERYIDEFMPSGFNRNLAIFYMDICGDVDLTVGKFRDSTAHAFNKDLEEMKSLYGPNNPYRNDTWVDTVLYGSKNSDKPIGVLKNPLTKLTLGTSEDFIEPMARGGTYLNYLQHKGYDLEKVLNTLGFKGKIDTKAYEEFRITCQEAINAMYATNFNYESTSKFQKVFAKFVPFPTFFLKNIAFWLDVAEKNPQVIDNTISLHEGLWSGKDTSDEFTAEAKGRGAIPIGQQKGVKHLTGLVKPTPYNSMFGAFGAINNPAENIAFRTNPLLRPVTRHLQDPEDVKYRPYNTQQFQKNIKQGDKDFSELAYMFHQLNPYDRYMNTYLRTPGKVSSKAYQFSDFLPSIFQPDFSKK